VVAFFQNFQVGVSFLGHMDCVLLKFQLAFVFCLKIRSVSYCHNLDSLELFKVAYEKFAYLHALSIPWSFELHIYKLSAQGEKELLHMTFSSFGIIELKSAASAMQYFLGKLWENVLPLFPCVLWWREPNRDTQIHFVFVRSLCPLSPPNPSCNFICKVRNFY
jgi:hypothetical protein